MSKQTNHMHKPGNMQKSEEDYGKHLGFSMSLEAVTTTMEEVSKPAEDGVDADTVSKNALQRIIFRCLGAAKPSPSTCLQNF